jgi:hypothetical protein
VTRLRRRIALRLRASDYEHQQKQENNKSHGAIPVSIQNRKRGSALRRRQPEND